MKPSSAGFSKYPFPEKMKRDDGSSMYAYVTFLIRNDGYLPGALLYAYGLKLQKTTADSVCFVSDNISEQAVFALNCFYDLVFCVDEIYVENENKNERSDLPYLFTRFHALRLGHDGNLGTRYEKIVLADSDVLPIKYYDHLFTLNAPAGILNEKPEHLQVYDEYGQYVIPDTVYEKGEWLWHEVYNPICPHGEKIPAYITDRINTDSSNMGVNSALYVIQPSYDIYKTLIGELTDERIQNKIQKFRWPEMQYLTTAWSGLWHNIDLKFCGFKGYPDIKTLYGIHYAGRNPWLINDYKSLNRMLKFPDNIVWYANYLKLINDYPQLLKVRRLKKLYDLLNIPMFLQMANSFELGIDN